MPPAVPELDRMGTTIGIAANPLYAAASHPSPAEQYDDSTCMLLNDYLGRQ